MVMVNVDKTFSDAEKWAKKYNFHFPMVIFSEQKKNEVIKKNFSGGMPTFALVSKTGEVISVGEEACKKKIKEL